MMMTDSVAEYDEAVTDDGALLLDRLVRSLHRNKDGFLAADERNPKHHIDAWHNAICLYIYTADDDELYTLNTYYVFGGFEPHSYEEWREIAFHAIDELNEKAEPNWHGVYAWSTTTIRMTPIRTGDLFIAVDASGVRGVRLSFNTRKVKREAHKVKKP
jgi:hypothetical protein